MRVLLDYRPALRQPTGVGTYVHGAARALIATAPVTESLTLFSASWKDRLAPDAVPGAAIVDRRIPVRVLNAAWHRLGWPAVETLARGTFDVIHGTHPILVPSWRAARLVTIYDLDFLDHPERYPREIGRDYPRLAARHAQMADRVVTISHHTAEAIAARLMVASDRISVCPPGAPDTPARSGEPESGGTVLFLGTIEPRKNLGVLLDAYARLIGRMPAPPPLVLAGRHGTGSASILDRIRREPLNGHVDAPGYVDAQTKRRLLEQALVFVLPSETEGFGIPVVEAMAAGVPVIVARRGALPEVVGAAGRLVDADSVDDLADALGDTLASRDRREHMAVLGRAQAGRFSWLDTASALREAWRLALEHRRTRRD